MATAFNKFKHLPVKEKGERSVGIITFHCADNYGAMLQAYGLKRYLSDAGVQVHIVRYEPFFMTGRHWWLPYIPIGRMKRRMGMSLRGWKAHIRAGACFFRLRKKMRAFRKEYLIEKGYGKLLFSRQFRRLPFRYYIVGSDQIWNPNITLGLRAVYFGAFPSRHKKKVVAYGASLGGEVLPDQYEKRFSRLLPYVDAVSLREADAVPYVQRFRREKVTAVLDPVFLPVRKCWEDLAKSPGRKNYILVYQTEQNRELVRYVCSLAKETSLPVLELQTGAGKTGNGFLSDFAVGPAEFLGYIREASYVVTNSFHAVSFSIIFEKKFLAYLYSGSGARVKNLLRVSGLENRLYEKDKDGQIDARIDWEEVKRKMKGHIRFSEAFLKENLPMLSKGD